MKKNIEKVDAFSYQIISSKMLLMLLSFSCLLNPVVAKEYYRNWHDPSDVWLRDMYLMKIDSLGDSLWTKTYGDSWFTEFGRSVQQTSDGGYIITGKISDISWTDVYLVKTDAYGDTLWTKVFPGGDIDCGNSVLETSDSCFIVAGVQDWDVYLLKTNQDGDTLWTEHISNYPIQIGNSVQQTYDGGYVIAAEAITGGSNHDIYLVKTDPDGNVQWDKTYGPGFYDEGWDAKQTPDSGYIVVGEHGAIYLVKTDSLGNQEWLKTYGGPDSDAGYSVALTSDGGYIVAGLTYSFGAGGSDVYLIKTDANGDTIWTRTFGGVENDGGASVTVTTESGQDRYVVVGFTDLVGDFIYDIYIICTDINGNVLWEKTYGDSELLETGQSIQPTSDGGYIIVGEKAFLSPGIEEEYSQKKSYDLRIYPNPSYGILNIDLPNDISDINLFDPTGRLIKKIVPTRNLKLDLLPGVYFFQIETQNQTKTEKIVILN